MQQNNTQQAALSDAAIKELWRRAVLSWKLDQTQKELYNSFYNSKHRLQTWLLSRRQGKTFTLCILALEQCIRKPNSIVKFVSPTKTQVNNNVRPIFRQILNDCPQELQPRFDKQTYIYFFPNGSEIQLAGSDAGHAEKLRGGDSDLFFIDEAGSCSDLGYVIKSILMPTTLTTRGRGVLASTPPRESEHEFLKYIEEAKAKGSLTVKTIDDNPRITQQEKDDLIEELGGITSDECKRECYCIIIKDSKTSVLPDFTPKLAAEITQEWPKPPYYHAYEAMDTGGKDFTVVLLGYYDYRADKVIIEDEIVMDFQEPNTTTKQLAEAINKKEKEHWTNPITLEYRKPHKRVSDIDYLFLNEIRVQSQLIPLPQDQWITFDLAKKDDKAAAINKLRIMLSAKKIIINPRCTTLLRHLDNVKWNKNKDKFARSADNGHYDAVDALIYFVRHVEYGRSPYPPGYDLNLNGLFVHNTQAFEKKYNNQFDVLRKIFNIKPPTPRKY